MWHIARKVAVAVAIGVTLGAVDIGLLDGAVGERVVAVLKLFVW